MAAHAVGRSPVREPDAGKRHVRFDERGQETEQRDGLRHRQLAKAAGNSYSPSPAATAPASDPTALRWFATLLRKAYEKSRVWV